MRFKRNKVWVAVDDQERPVVEKAKVLIKYQLEQKHQYWVHSKSVIPLTASLPISNDQSCEKCAEHTIDPELFKKAIRIYTDGACSENPGPAGIGIVMQYQQHQKEISRNIGTATSNIAELEAIKVGLQSITRPNLPVILFTDSRYASGLRSKKWKPKENIKLVCQIKNLLSKFHSIHVVKISKHVDHPENKRADQLAMKAIQKISTQD